MEEYEEYGDEEYDDQEEEDVFGEPIEGGDGDCNTSNVAYKSYTVLSEHEVHQRQTHQVSQLANLFSLSPPFATALLCHYKWNTTKVYDEWFADEEKVRTTVGILHVTCDNNEHGKVSSPSTTTTCQICFDDFSFDETYTAGCCHTYCLLCWRSYITSKMEFGPRVLSLRCPEPKCPRAVTYDMINKFASEEEKKQYFSYVRRSYVEGRGEKIKWCPAPDCENSVEFERGGSDVYDVVCACTNVFCWNCTGEGHRPSDCKTVEEWTLKNNSEAENTKYILAFTKPCPECKRPIEKNMGCNHMSCPCGFEFCWFCLQSFKDVHYSCNKYTGKQEGASTKENESRKMAKTELMKYMHYYERWATNDKSMKKAVQDLQKAKNVLLMFLGEKLGIPETELEFILKAWQQIVNCRRVLKWSYVFGFYFPENEFAKKNVFEYMQHQAEITLEKLHHCAETELKDKLVEVETDPKAQLPKFKEKLNGLIGVTGNHFDNFLRALDNGLSEVDSLPPPSKIKNIRGSSSAQSVLESQAFVLGDGDEFWWQCDRCTYLNPESAEQCDACHNAY